jgi:sulfur-oxidizing protein SoxY
MEKERRLREFDRREILIAAGAGGLAISLVAIASNEGLADAPAVEAAINEITGGATPQEGNITLEIPEIAENGNAVPITVDVESPMTAADYVRAVHIFADGNPSPRVASFHFSPRNGIARVSTRMRLATTQSVFALADMSDGSLYMDQAHVKVTLGGCGG